MRKAALVAAENSHLEEGVPVLDDAACDTALRELTLYGDRLLCGVLGGQGTDAGQP